MIYRSKKNMIEGFCSVKFELMRKVLLKIWGGLFHISYLVFQQVRFSEFFKYGSPTELVYIHRSDLVKKRHYRFYLCCWVTFGKWNQCTWGGCKRMSKEHSIKISSNKNWCSSLQQVTSLKCLTWTENHPDDGMNLKRA